MSARSSLHAHQCSKPIRPKYSVESVGYQNYLWLLGPDFDPADLESFAKLRTIGKVANCLASHDYRQPAGRETLGDGIIYGRNRQTHKVWLLKHKTDQKALGWAEAEYLGQEFSTLVLHCAAAPSVAHENFSQALAYLISALYIGERVDRIRVIAQGEELAHAVENETEGDERLVLFGSGGAFPGFVSRHIIDTDHVQWWQRDQVGFHKEHLAYLEKRRHRFERENLPPKPRVRRVSLLRRIFGGGLKIRRRKGDDGWSNFSKR